MFQLVSREANVEQVATQSFKNALRGVPAGYNQQLVHEVFAVSQSDILRVLQTRIKPLFQATTAAVAVTTSVSKATHVCDGLARIGWPVQVVENLDEWFCSDMGERGHAHNRSLGGAASPDFVFEDSSASPTSPPPVMSATGTASARPTPVFGSHMVDGDHSVESPVATRSSLAAATSEPVRDGTAPDATGAAPAPAHTPAPPAEAQASDPLAPTSWWGTAGMALAAAAVVAAVVIGKPTGRLR
mgnify:CR=1 FL=1